MPRRCFGIWNEKFKVTREYSERADFIRCTLWGKGADLAVKVKRNDYIKVNGDTSKKDDTASGSGKADDTSKKDDTADSKTE